MRLNWLDDAAVRSCLEGLTTAQLLSLNKSIHSTVCSGAKARLVESAAGIIHKYAPLLPASSKLPDQSESWELAPTKQEIFAFCTGTRSIEFVHLIPTNNFIDAGKFEYNLQERSFDPYEGTEVASKFISLHLKELLSSSSSKIPLLLLSSKTLGKGSPFGIFRFPNAINCMLLDMFIHSQLFQVRANNCNREILLDQIALGTFSRANKDSPSNRTEHSSDSSGVQLVKSEKRISTAGKTTRMSNHAHFWLMTRLKEGYFVGDEKFKKICQNIDEFSRPVLCIKAFFDTIQTLNQFAAANDAGRCSKKIGLQNGILA